MKYTMSLVGVLLLLTCLPGCPKPIPIAVSATAPANGSENVPVTSTISITFTLSALPDTLEIQVTPLFTYGIAWSNENRTVTLTPVSALSYAASYTITVLGVVSKDNVPLNQAYVFTFGTEASAGEGESEGGGEGLEEGESEGLGEGDAEGVVEGETEGETVRSQVTFTTTAQVMVNGNPVDSDTLWRVEAVAGAVPENVSAALQPFAVNPEGLDEGPIRVSWNGLWYAFSSERFDAEAAGWAGLAVAPGDLSGVVSVRTATGIIHGNQPSITNDGLTVVYVGADGPHNTDIYATHRQGLVWSDPVALSAGSPFLTHERPVISPEGSTVLFSAGNDFDHLIVCAVSMDGSGFRQAITMANAPAGSQDSQVYSPAYAPDGSIVFETAWTGGEQIWRLPSGNATKPVLVTAEFNNDNSPVVLPDGRIASLWMGHPDGNSGHHLKIMSAHGQNYFMLTLPAIPPNIQDVSDFGLGAGEWP